MIICNISINYKKLQTINNKDVSSMSDHSPQIWNVMYEVLKVMLLTLFGWVTWAYRRHANELQHLKENSIKRDEYNNTIERLSREIKELHRDIQDSARETHRRLDKLYLHNNERKE